LSGQPAGNYDFDALPNLLEYASGTNPAAVSPPPVAALTTTHLTLTYQRDTAATGVTLTAQASTTAATWAGLGQFGLTDELVSTSGTIQTRRASLPLGNGVRLLRLQATLTP
jgi:hypothetical protein